MDFSRNLSSALEIHGEWARIENFTHQTVSQNGRLSAETRDVTSSLLGLRYLSERDTTYILEYYRNGTGYSESQTRDFFSLVDNGLGQYQATGNETLIRKALAASESGYGRANVMRRYLYLRVSQKEPFDIVYFTPSLTLIGNLDDHSYSLTPELLYTGVTNLDLRLRAAWLVGGTGSEFGEKQNSRKLELMLRYYF
ncbi:MAG: hypothetical protein HYU74_09665 [Dechloromonas sp.]|nr:hypothetical protein [Dechloromonas sp.]